MMTLTKWTSRTLRSIAEFNREYGYAPTVLELAEAMFDANNATSGNLSPILRVLRAEGLITYRDHTARTIRITPQGH